MLLGDKKQLFHMAEEVRGIRVYLSGKILSRKNKF